MSTVFSKKMAIIDTLQSHQSELSLSELLTKLGPGYTERTVRRWLADFVKQGTLKQTGHTRGTRYCMAEQSFEPAQPAAIFTDRSAQLIEKIKQPLHTRSPIDYQLDFLDCYQPDQSQYFTDQQLALLAQTGDQYPTEQPAGTYARLVYNRLLIDLSFNSSRLEGNTYSLLDTEQLLLEGEIPSGKLDHEKVMILNHKEAIRYLVDHATTLSLIPETLFTLHYLLSDGLVPNAYAGKLRDHTVRISHSCYLPLVDKYQVSKQLALICQKATAITNLYEQSLFLLVHISYLQAFVDVNKRTARFAANIGLLKNNCVPLSFNDMGKEDYIAAMIAIYELNAVEPLADLYLYSYLRTCKQYQLTRTAFPIDQQRVRYRQQRRQILSHIMINLLIGQKMQAYIAAQTQALIPSADQNAFIAHIEEELDQISAIRAAGLGVTTEQLQRWLEAQDKTH